MTRVKEVRDAAVQVRAWSPGEEVAEVPSGLHMREIVVSWRASFYDNDMQGRVCSSQATCDDAASRATLKQALSTSAQRKEREVPTSGDDDIILVLARHGEEVLNNASHR